MAGRICWRVFYAAGVNHVWAFNQHDKWQCYGLKLHLGIEPFTGLLLWLIVWWTNSNPEVGWLRILPGSKEVRRYATTHLW
jgi:hypothetical protein